MRIVLSLTAAAIILSLSGCMQTLYVAAAAQEKMKCLSQPDNQPQPSRREASFPFRIAYEIDGRRTVLEDTQICEFKGRTCSALGRSDLWESRFASGKPRILVKQIDKSHEFVAVTGECPVLMTSPQYREVAERPWEHVDFLVYKHGRLKETISASEFTQAEYRIKVTSFEQWLGESPRGP